jgi:hypothetical protein
MSVGINIDSLHPSQTVRDIQTRDGVLLLDIEQGRCLAISPVGVLIWKELRLNRSADEILNHLYTKFPQVPSERIREDFIGFTTQLSKQELMTHRRARPEHGIPKLIRLLRSHKQLYERRRMVNTSVPRFLLLKAIFGLLIFDALRFRGRFAKIHASIRAWPVAKRSTSSPDVLEKVCQAVNYACVWYPKRVLCLQRSAVTTCLLRHCGLSAEMVVGAQAIPFKAHAWTEVDGQVVNERRHVQRAYMVWDRC